MATSKKSNTVDRSGRRKLKYESLVTDILPDIDDMDLFLNTWNVLLDPLDEDLKVPWEAKFYRLVNHYHLKRDGHYRRKRYTEHYKEVLKNRKEKRQNLWAKQKRAENKGDTEKVMAIELEREELGSPPEISTRYIEEFLDELQIETQKEDDPKTLANINILLNVIKTEPPHPK